MPQSPATLPAPLVQLLRDDFELLANKALADSLTAYVLQGETPEALVKLAQEREAGPELRLQIFTASDTNPTAPPRLEFLRRLPQPDLIPVLVRLSEVWEAACTQFKIDAATPDTPGEALWLHIFVTELAPWIRHQKTASGIPLRVVEQAVEARSGDPDLLARKLICPADQFLCHHRKNLRRTALRFEDAGDLGPRHAALVSRMLRHDDIQTRLLTLDFLRASDTELSHWTRELVELLCGTSKQAREAAEGALTLLPKTVVVKEATRVLDEGNAGQKFEAARYLSKDFGEVPEVKSRFLALRESEKSGKLKQLLEEHFAQVAEAAGTVKLVIPAEPELDEAGDLLPADFEKVLRPILKEADREERKSWVENNKLASLGFRTHPEPVPMAPRIQEFMERLRTGELTLQLPRRGRAESPLRMTGAGAHNALLLKVAQIPGLKLVQLFRLSCISGYPPGNMGWYRYSRMLTTHGPFDLRHGARLLRKMGIGKHQIGLAWLNWDGFESIGVFPPEFVWPYFAENLEVLEAVLGMRELADMGRNSLTDEPTRQKAAYRVIEMFPVLPPSIRRHLQKVALGNSKSERPLAQQILDKHPPGQSQPRPAAPASKGKSIPQVLEQGQSLDRKQLLADARKGLAKGVPAYLQWCPLDSIPRVRWADTGEAVEAELVRWWVVQSARLKDPAPSPLLQKLAKSLREEDALALGRWVLNQWMEADDRLRYRQDELAAAVEARLKEEMAHMTAQAAADHPRYMRDYYTQTMAGMSAGLGTDCRGMLALVSACSSGDVAPVILSYLKKHYGTRMAGSKALIHVLGWIAHPNAIQILLSVGDRFRTKALKVEAARQCNLLAERHGWTLEELADRTIPAGGFDEHNLMDLDFGPRQFVAKLTLLHEIELHDPDGVIVTALPAPAKSDDPDLAAAAIKKLSAAKKELKLVLKLQKERLYVAMCLQRAWPFADWDLFLNRHPVVGYYAQQLIWSAWDGETYLKSFRPLNDRTLTDCEDNAITLPKDATIRLAHGLYVSQSEAELWKQQFEDYRLMALFDQFRREPKVLTEDLARSTMIEGFQGYVMDTFTIRKKATKLGYVPAADRGLVTAYVKPFASLDAAIEFTGSPTGGNQNIPVALLGLKFTRAGSDGTGPLPLGELSPVLVSECWNDLEQIAAGSEFAPDWKTRFRVS